MKLLKFAIIIAIVTLQSCQIKKEKSDPIVEVLSSQDSIALNLFNNKCMICHGFEGKTEATMIAPPMYAVKMRYLKKSDVKEEFVSNMSAWVKKPEAERGLMKAALKEKGLMPHLSYTEEDINTIVNYIYKFDMPKPDWFDEHQNSHQKSGTGL